MLNNIIDLSHHNTIEDFEAIKSEGIIGIIHKATEGSNFVDKKYYGRKKKWEEMGGLFGAYHFLRTNGRREAKRFLEIVEPSESTLLALDYEVAVNISVCEEFVSVIYDAMGKYPLFYINNSMLNSNDFENSILLNCPLWVARYGKSPSIPLSFGNFKLWQYTDRGRVNGIGGNVDRNYFNGNVAELYEMWNVPYQAEAINGEDIATDPNAEKGIIT